MTAISSDPLWIPPIALESVICENRVDFAISEETAFVVYEWLWGVWNELCWLNIVDDRPGSSILRMERLKKEINFL